MNTRNVVAKLGSVIFVVAVLSGLLIWMDAENAKKAKEREEEAEENRTRVTIHKFAQSHNASDDWQKKLPNKSFGEAIYSTELAEVFSREKKPVLFLGEVYDIRETQQLDGQHYPETYSVELRGWVSYRTQFKLTLACPPDLTKAFMQHPSGGLNKFAVVADVIDVSAADVRDSDGQPNRWLAIQGQCDAVLYLGSYIGDFKDALSEALDARKDSSSSGH